MIYLLILLLALFQAVVTDYLIHNPDYYQLNSYTWESDSFRAMRLGELLASQEEMDYRLLTALMIENDYDLTKLESLKGNPDRIHKSRGADFQKLLGAYETAMKDLTVFPIPLNTRKDLPDICYTDSWLGKRTYGGERGHEGCDIMGTAMPRGFYPVVSMSDGIIEKIGWLEQGGWRIGIRTDGGSYIYYAHLYGYAEGLSQGMEIKAGELLGYMGDTGYSTIEGTTGNFDVHLHVGIYLKTDHYDEISVNPYWILRYLEKFRLKYKY